MHDPNAHGTSWAEWSEGLRAIGLAFSVGLVRTGYLISRGRKWTWFDVLIEPCVASLAGWMVWQVGRYASIDVDLLPVLVSLGAWGGPKTIAVLDRRYLQSLGGSERSSRPMPLDSTHGKDDK